MYTSSQIRRGTISRSKIVRSAKDVKIESVPSSALQGSSYGRIGCTSNTGNVLNVGPVRLSVKI